MTLTVYAAGPALYAVSRSGHQVGLISTSGGRWLLHEMDGQTLIGRDPVDVTAELHNSRRLHAVLVAYLPAQRIERGRRVDISI